MNFRNLVASLALALAPAALAQPLSTAFTFQGELKDGPNVAGGTFDLRFRLYDALTGGSQLGPQLCSDNITVADGRVTVQLDFGSQFSGQRRWLEVEARQDTGLDCTNAAGFVILLPRQELTAAPNAVYSLNAASAINATQLNGQPASFYQSASNLTSGTLPLARGGTGGDFSVTGGPGRVLQQLTAGGPLTVANLTESAIPALTLGGDLAGSQGAATVTGLRNRPLGTGVPAIGDALAWDGSRWSPSQLTLGGDLSGAHSSATVLRIQNRNVSSAAPGINDLLTWNGSSWSPAPLSLNGDITGTASLTVVSRIRNAPVSTAFPSGGDYLRFNGATVQWEPTPLTAGNLPAHTHAPTDLTSAVPLTLGGTGATSATNARTNLDVPGLNSPNAFAQINVLAGGAVVQPPNTVTVPLQVNAPSGQSAELQSWSVNGAPMARVLANGAVVSNFYMSAATQVLSPAFNFTSAHTRTYAINGSDFTPGNQTFQYTKSTSTGLSAPVQTGTLEFFCPIHLPDGANITSVVAYVVDSYAPGNMSVEVYFHTYGAAASSSSSANSSALSGSGTVTVNTGATVLDNETLSCFIRVTWPGAAGTAIQLRDVKVTYNITTPEP